MLAGWLVVMSPALAQDGIALEPGEFVVSLGDSVATVRHVPVPFGAPLKNPDRVCRVSLMARGASVVPEVAEDCHPGISWAVEDVADQWRIDVAKPPARDQRLFEIWYVFPTRRGAPVRTLVRQSWKSDLTLTTSDIDVVDYRIEGMLPPRYPAEALGTDTRITQCDVDVDLGASQQVRRVEIRDCDEVFHAEAERTARGWMIQEPSLRDVSLTTGLTFGVRFERNLKGDGGTAFVQLPEAPELGSRTVTSAAAAAPEPPVRPAPTDEPQFVLNHRSFAEVGVYDMVWPAGKKSRQGLTCDVLVQVNSAQQVWVWPERCDASVASQVIDAASRWYLSPGEIERAERYARFRGTFVFPADGGPPIVRVPKNDVAGDPTELPERVESYLPARPVDRHPPKRPKVVTTPPRGDVECQFRVEVNRRGRPAAIEAIECPGDFVDSASSAIAKWRWMPAEANGQPLASTTQVRVRFGGTR